MHCPKCECEVPSKKILQHWRDYHDDDKDFSVECPECSVQYHTKSTFQKHWYSTHHRKKEQDPPKQSKWRRVEESSNAPVTNIETQVSNQEIPDDYPASTGTQNVQEGSLSVAVTNIVHQCSSQDFHGDSTVSVETHDCHVEVNDSSSQDFHGDSTVSVETHDCHVEVNDSSSESNDESDSDSDSGVPLRELFLKGASTAKPVETQRVNPAGASFILNLRDKCSVPNTGVQSMLTETENLVQSAMHEFSSKLQEKLKEKGIALEDVVNIEETVKDSSNVFENLKTTKKQNQYFKEELNFIEPTRIPLGRTLKKRRKKGMTGMQVCAVADEVVYVPLKKTVDRLVNHPDYEHFVEEGKRARNTPFLDSYMKGERCKNNKVIQEHPDALRFVLFYDDLEACSPLKSKAGKFKIGAFYLYIDNIPLKYRSRLSNIFLVALVNANHISGKDYGIDAAMESIVSVIKEFENGVMLPSGKFVFGTLIAVIGDNKGLHAIGGFKEGFTAHRPCRFCSATFKEVQTMTKEIEELLRDIKSYTEQCEKVQTVKGKNEKLSTEYGINRDSILNTLISYHVLGGLPPDCMHDILEGALALAIKKLLKHYLYEVDEKPFTLDWLNAAIENFDFGYAEESSKPSKLKKEYIDTNDNSTKIHQSASQTWMLATILPLIVGPLVDENDEYYQNFLDILEICRIIFSTDILPWMLSYLQDLIEKYLLQYKSLYGDLIPKQHHMIHYPRMIREMGSLVAYMCMRMEAKHKYFKKLVYVIQCYKNLFWSLAMKHELHMAVEWSKSLKHSNTCGPTQVVDAKDCVYKHLLPSKTTKLVEATWLNYEGNKFTAGDCFICIGYNEESGPIFVKVNTVIIHPSIVFICQKTLTVKKNIHLAAYEIKMLEETCTADPSQMLYHSILHAHMIQGHLYIALKYSTGGEVV